MADPELEAIRQKRLAELASREDGAGGVPSSVMSKLGGQPAGGAEEDAKKAENEEMRRTAVSQIIDNDARERLSRIALVRPQRARQVEDMLIRMAQTGQLRGRVTEEQLISVLDQLERAESGSTASVNQPKKITYVRKDAFDDDDWDL
ncbi:hypothetical protein MJO28_011807 [Puccinia striiformis f. sp. tritici]|uniref:Programmed cell death protein 5 n=4 Tax=Puccinia striiformis TaxID=27350 RepID=A0A0L0UWR5_9BASI|nr:hypothetical protein Pst134EA_021383 [Puccinia striiformis f. sp. tritici]KNE91473.1 hypothetical protein PSTG_15104 [Puccinia striiformis f. sp. tritici PST-78]POW01451.1 hypothetical protein PSTT_12519 [Puccinia striiformis]KAH9448265.1 hypothetical protein Pst134EB_022253 [Puccinia striiformis f. sp. tritici]KAH9457507.1 hypothetical protein Pst134EA_021383 [Puccinia striiformis f. sp. tritici]KAI7944279.1 hypothetical protein MJO28_011807 [Puccinia striiformis f. sp. tritici]